MKSDLSTDYIHFKQGSRAKTIRAGADFWEKLSSGLHPELDSGRLMIEFSFDAPWETWERHPHGEELVLLLEGHATLICQLHNEIVSYRLAAPGEYVLVPKDTWHTADTDVQTRMLFLTPGKDTDHKPR